MSHPSKLNSHTGLAFILGVLFLAVVATAYILVAGEDGLSLSVEGEDSPLESAAEAISDS